ncbi:COP9 signalosome complex subunit 6 isoform X3 [Octopus sinensis]|uniref:COP9 signalosome complex subunit 6 n=1 Tax=Octopus sinensis TaxID=2607531 RepID=A0A6P7S5Q8_9MOLL|nr:COP9 signalosome complex subunit 6 isoform X3 [Octopus sinensis]
MVMYMSNQVTLCARLCRVYDKMACLMEVDKPSTSNGTGVEVENGDECDVIAPAGTAGSVSVSLHPLVIMNISEHWTRVRAQEGKPMQVLGALIGQQKDRNLEVMNSFELAYDKVNDIVINMEYYKTKEEQFKQVFSDMDFLGWYTTGGPPTLSDIKVHRQMCRINESPIFLKLNPLAGHTDLPVTLYESLINGQSTLLFVSLEYTLATEEAERIGVDHVARVSTSDSGESSSVAEHLIAQHSSIKMLDSRVKLLLQYIKAVQAGDLKMNHDILREAYSLCYRLPVINTPKFREDFYTQCNDVCLMSYLGTITKSCNTINQFVNKFNVLYDRQGMGRRMRGLFF